MENVAVFRQSGALLGSAGQTVRRRELPGRFFGRMDLFSDGLKTALDRFLLVEESPAEDELTEEKGALVEVLVEV
jgi:hypothetical protein